MMKIILQEDVPHLGVVGDLVTVRDGYARNYLIPTGRAVFASVKSVKQLDHQKRLAAHLRAQATEEARAHKAQIEMLSVVTTAKVAPLALDDDGEPIPAQVQRLFGTITNRDLARALRESGIQVDHRRISLNDAVRTVGKFSATVRLDGGIEAELPFWVIPEGATDIEEEKKRVVAAQEAAVRAKEEAERQEAEAAAAAAQAAAAEAEAEAEPDEGEDADDADASDDDE